MDSEKREYSDLLFAGKIRICRNPLKLVNRYLANTIANYHEHRITHFTL